MLVPDVPSATARLSSRLSSAPSRYVPTNRSTPSAVQPPLPDRTRRPVVDLKSGRSAFRSTAERLSEKARSRDTNADYWRRTDSHSARHWRARREPRGRPHRRRAFDPNPRRSPREGAGTHGCARAFPGELSTGIMPVLRAVVSRHACVHDATVSARLIVAWVAQRVAWAAGPSDAHLPTG